LVAARLEWTRNSRILEVNHGRHQKLNVRKRVGNAEVAGDAEARPTPPLVQLAEGELGVGQR
jgi:hypothetical protein